MSAQQPFISDNTRPLMSLSWKPSELSPAPVLSVEQVGQALCDIRLGSSVPMAEAMAAIGQSHEALRAQVEAAVSRELFDKVNTLAERQTIRANKAEAQVEALQTEYDLLLRTSANAASLIRLRREVEALTRENDELKEKLNAR